MSVRHSGQLVTSVCPDWAIYWTLGIFLKPLAIINLPKSSTLLDNFCKGVKIYNFPSEIILGNFIDIWRFFPVTLLVSISRGLLHSYNLSLSQWPYQIVLMRWDLGGWSEWNNDLKTIRAWSERALKHVNHQTLRLQLHLWNAWESEAKNLSVWSDFGKQISLW